MHKFLIIALVLTLSCKPKPFPDDTVNQFDDEQLVKIYSLQDERNTIALIPYLKAKKESHRVQAALAFASLQDTIAIPYLAQMLLIDQDEMPRRAAAVALGQLRSESVSKILREAFASDFSKENQEFILEAIGKCIDSTSYRFLDQFEAVEKPHQRGWLFGVYHALEKKYHSERIYKRVWSALHDEELEPLAALYLLRYEYIVGHQDRASLETILKTLKTEEAKTRIRQILHPDKPMSVPFDADWVTEFSQMESIYEKVLWIESLRDEDGADGRHYLLTLIDDTTSHYLVKNAALKKIVGIEKAGSYYPEFINDAINQALLSGDMSLQSIAVKALMDSVLRSGYGQVDLQLVKDLRQELDMPRQLETYVDLSKLIAKIEGVEYTNYVPPFNHPIDWEFVHTIPSEQEVLVQTNRGDITLRCAVDDAPGTVSNFLKLVDSGFYDNKSFHRVVDNFVIQTGCPRGDGWGSLDWTQRSEFSNFLRYKPGTVGIASYGKDTEGVQWFVTHHHTTALDGRYTIFAQVVKGMDVVRKIAFGDSVLSVKRLEKSSAQSAD